jgi:cell division septal protein FtsQ
MAKIRLISNIHVNKDLPNKISIGFDKIIPKYIWVQGGEYFIVGENGYVIDQLDEEKDDTEASSADFDITKIKSFLRNSGADLDSLIIYNNSTKDLGLRDYINNDDLKMVSQINSKVAGKINTDIILYKLNSSELHDLEIYTEQGWVIKLNLDNIDEQLENLYSVLKINFKNSQPLEYVDLRYGKKVYFK